MDFYLNKINTINRLVNEWYSYGKIIIGVDFDDTIYDFHKKGRKHDNVINLLKQCKEVGCYIIINTCNKDYEFIKKYCSEIGIEIDSINENMPFTKFDTEKIYCNIMLDDRAGLESAYTALQTALNIVSVRNRRYCGRVECND